MEFKDLKVGDYVYGNLGNYGNKYVKYEIIGETKLFWKLQSGTLISKVDGEIRGDRYRKFGVDPDTIMQYEFGKSIESLAILRGNITKYLAPKDTFDEVKEQIKKAEQIIKLLK